MFVIQIRGPVLPWNVAFFLHNAVAERKSISSEPPGPSSQTKGSLFVLEGQKAEIKRQTQETEDNGEEGNKKKLGDFVPER